MNRQRPSSSLRKVPKVSTNPEPQSFDVLKNHQTTARRKKERKSVSKAGVVFEESGAPAGMMTNADLEAVRMAFLAGNEWESDEEGESVAV